MTTLNFKEINILPRQAGICMICNILNNHKYIGSTNDFKRRLMKHRSELRKNKHHSTPLQRAFNKYGEDKFSITILEVCEPIHDTLIMLEQKYLDLSPEYNCVKYASRKYSKILIRTRTNKVKRKVDQYSLDGKYITTFNSIADAAKSFSKTRYASIRTGISKCCNGRLTKTEGYLWKYTTDTRSIYQVCKHKKPNGIKVDKLDLKGNYICTYNNMVEAAIDCGSIKNRSAINRVCRGQKRTAFGFKWKYNYDK